MEIFLSWANTSRGRGNVEYLFCLFNLEGDFIFKTILMSFLYLILFALLLPHNVSAGFYTPRILDVPEVNHSLTISVNFSSVTDPNMCYRKLYDDLWGCCSVATGSCTVPASDLGRIGTYEYFFNEGGGERFPQYTGTFKFSVNEKNDAFRNKSVSFVEHDPE